MLKNKGGLRQEILAGNKTGGKWAVDHFGCLTFSKVDKKTPLSQMKIDRNIESYERKVIPKGTKPWGTERTKKNGSMLKGSPKQSECDPSPDD